MSVAKANDVAPQRRAANHAAKASPALPPATTSTESGAKLFAKANTGAPQRQRANQDPGHQQTPPSAELSSEASVAMNTSERTPRKRRAATVVVNTIDHPPPAGSNAIAMICQQLAELQKARMFAIKSQSRCDRSMQAAIARCLGYSSDMEKEEDRKRLFKQAAAIMAAVEAGKPPKIDMPAGDPRLESLATFIPLIPLSAQSRAVWDEQREKVEKDMRVLVAELPVLSWVQENAKGVGELGLARLVGEAPMIGQLATPYRLWKRMGLAVIGEERQQKRTDENEALIHGYSPRRRAEAWSVCSDTLFRQQWRRAKEDDEDGVGYPIGPYGEVYRARKAATLPRIAETSELPWNDRRKWTPLRCDRDARRVMTKEFLRDLWRVWHGKAARHPARWAALQQPEQKIA